MGTDFERLMQLADRNKADIERAAQERKRLAGVISNKDRSSEREADERRRKRLVEERIQQREHDENQRQRRAKMALERRKQERAEAERADEAQRKQTQRQKQQPMQQQQQQRAGYAGGSGSGIGSGAKSSAARRPEANSAVAGAKKPAEAQPVSFQDLMRIAAQNAAAPAKSADKALRTGAQPGSGSSRAAPLPARSPTGRAVLQSAGVRRAGDRSRSPRKAARAQSPADNRRARSRSPVDRRRAAPAPVRSSAPGLAHCPAPVGTQHVRQPPRPTTTSLTHRMVAGKRQPAARRDRADAVPAFADPAAPKASARLPPQEQQQTVRKPPEREIDRFGVRSGATLAARRPTLPGRGASRDSVGAAERRAQPSALAPARARSIRDERDARSVRSPASHLDGRGARPLVPPALRAGENSRSRGDDQRALPRNNSAVGRPNRAGGGGAMQKRRREEYYDDHDGESDYDSLDDFVVDDEEEGGVRYREGAIRRMLGVQYRDVDDDDDDGDDMEVSASQLMREERISAKIGRQEDEEEERRQEEAERARKRRVRERERR
ncbi:hypothetical protein LPJ66_007926 [Kickxella alabastrina]|uniref:Uncharacterized protein n=1 Tax=Kickxella alabastrina TaxID=61397 RepID=A0ACC1IB85_9FUNG|nr:hypothetical protein LPJ66_007926 [Kickxella alabastrina]